MNGWQEEQLHALLHPESREQFLSRLSQLAVALGFEYCAYALQSSVPVCRPRLIMLNNYPIAWQRRYEMQNYIAHDPIARHGRRTVMPMIWSSSASECDRLFWDDAHAHGIKEGWSQSCFDGRGVGGMLTLARGRDPVSVAEQLALGPKISWLSTVAYTGLSALTMPELTPESSARLSAREAEVMRWTADGKTSNEVGDILYISERTVNFHVNNVLRKLNATNKIGGAVKAAMLGLL